MHTTDVVAFGSKGVNLGHPVCVDRMIWSVENGYMKLSFRAIWDPYHGDEIKVIRVNVFGRLMRMTPDTITLKDGHLFEFTGNAWLSLDKVLEAWSDD